MPSSSASQPEAAAKALELRDRWARASVGHVGGLACIGCACGVSLTPPSVGELQLDLIDFLVDRYDGLPGCPGVVARLTRDADSRSLLAALLAGLAEDTAMDASAKRALLVHIENWMASVCRG